MINNQEQRDSLLPPPEILTKYKESGMSEDLIELVRTEQEHRHILQNKYQLSYRMGQIFGFVLSFTVIYNVFNLMNNGYTKESYFLLAIFSLLLVIITFLVRNNRKTTTRRNNNTTRNRNTYSPRRNVRNYR